MPRFAPEPPYSHGTAAKTGILITNLGTPDEPTAPAVRRYLKQILSDPRVVEIPRAKPGKLHVPGKHRRHAELRQPADMPADGAVGSLD